MIGRKIIQLCQILNEIKQDDSYNVYSCYLYALLTKANMKEKC